MKEIKLTKGFVTLVDDSDYDWLNHWKWYVQKGRYTWYAARNQWNKKDKVNELILMHRLILNTPKGITTDHEDHNGLNNQRYNIRNATYSQNSQNRKVSYKNETGYLGVHYVIIKLKSGIIKKHIKAMIRTKSKHKNLGYFPTEIEAAKAYDRAALKYHGEFANINFKN